MYQAAIFIAVAWANIYFEWTTNGWLVGLWAFFAAYVLTSFPLAVYDWWAFRHARREEYAAKKAAGIPYGWRVHLPWNSRAASKAALNREVGSERRIRR
jgi:hypothetical protein